MLISDFKVAIDKSKGFYLFCFVVEYSSKYLVDELSVFIIDSLIGLKGELIHPVK